MNRTAILAACLGFWVSGCASLPTTDAQICRTSVFVLDANFAAGGMKRCAVEDNHTITVFLAPEETPINKSPWYAVRLTPSQPDSIRVILRYEEHPHRYRPKIASRGNWSPVPDEDVSVSEDGFSVAVEIALDRDPVFLAGQEIFHNQIYIDWIALAAARAHVTERVIGYSVEGRSVTLIETKAKKTPAPTLMLVGRQHPPEITGALAMIEFMEEVLGDSSLAVRFRKHVNIVMIPNMNPDGVEHGYWRHNVGGVDLNRDWGPFTQPETRAVRDFLDADPDSNIVLFLDFHSTWKNVFYTQPENDDGSGYGFTRQWLARARARLPEAFKFTRQGSHNRTPTSKTYMHTRFGVPAITYETGDETDRDLVSLSARVFAQEMMKLLLENRTTRR